MRETFYIDHCEYLGKLKGLPPLTDEQKRSMLYYAADGDVCGQIPECECSDGGPKLHPSIFMPRWASRITLEITDVRVERVQGITEADAIAEGVEWQTPGPERNRLRYRELWDSLNAKRGFGWDKNLWVWVLTFKRIKPTGD